MKIAVRCLYSLPVTPNFLIMDLDKETWPKFCWGDKKTRIDIVRPYLPKHHPGIREIAWIPLGSLTEIDKSELIINLLYK